MNPTSPNPPLISLEDLTLEELKLVISSYEKLSHLERVDHQKGKVTSISIRKGLQPYEPEDFFYEIEFEPDSGGVLTYEYSQREISSL